MSVPECERGEGKFTVLVEANGLVCYTLQICSNEKSFDPKFQTVIMNDIVETAKNIYISAYTANEIKVDSTETARDRLYLIRKATVSCDRLMALMQIAKRIYHVDSKRIRYWGGKTKAVKDLLSKWHNSESKRYKEYLLG